MNDVQQHDILISGAGPAGTHLALRLATAGWSVGLVDRKTFPRPKPCGEFLSPECIPLLAEVGLKESLICAGARRVGGMKLHGFGRLARGSYKKIGNIEPPDELGMSIRREVLDAMAVERAERSPRIQTYLGWDVSEVLVDEEGRATGLSVRDPFGQSVELRSRFIVGADGTKSRVARQLGWHERDPEFQRWALVARFQGVEPLESAEVHFLKDAYFAACTIDDEQFTANLVVNATALPRGAHNLQETFFEHVRRAPALASRLENATLVGQVGACGPLASRSTQCVGPGAALVGDACRFVDPLTGEGLFMAMRGASLLADALHASLSRPEREAQELVRYAARRDAEFGPRYKLASLLQRGIRHPALISGALRLLAHRPGLCDLLVALTGDYVPHSELLRPAVWLQAFRRSHKLVEAS